MELSAVAVHFDTEVFEDYFDSADSFSGQVRAFSESTRSGPASRRRILSLDPDITIPTRRVIKLVSTGKAYVTAGGNEDYWQDAAIRKKYPLLPVDYQAVVGTAGQHLAGTYRANDIFMFANYVRRIPVEQDTSIFYAGYEIFFSSYESVLDTEVIKLNSDYYRVKVASSTDGAGFGLCEAVHLPEPVQTLSYESTTGSVYDPVTDTYSATTIAGVSVFIEPAQLNYLYTSPAFEKVMAGDKAITVLKSDVATAVVGDTAGTREVLSVRDGSTFWVLHCR